MTLYVRSNTVNPSHNSNVDVMKKHNSLEHIYQYKIRKKEDEVIALINRCKPLSLSEISSLSDIAERGPMFRVRISLNQLKKDYMQCIKIFI